MNLARAWRDLVVGGVAVTAVAFSVGACAGSAPNAPTSPASQPAGPPPVTAPLVTETTAAAPQPQECTETVSLEQGSLSGKGSGGSTYISNSGIFFTCGGGLQPTLSVTKITATTVTLTPYGESKPCLGGFTGFDTAPTCDPKTEMSTVIRNGPTGPPVTIANGSSGTVVSYRISVLSIDAGTAVFTVVTSS